MERNKENKNQIYYARTYRRLQIRRTPGMILSFMGILAAVVMFVWNISALTNLGVNFLVCLVLFLFMLLLRKSLNPLAIFDLFGEPFRNEYICLRINIKWVTISVEV